MSSLRPRRIHTIDDYDVDLLSIIGKGGYGMVYKGEDHNGKSVAAKNVLYVQNDNVQEGAWKVGATEIAIFNKLGQHPNIIKLLHIFDDKESIWFFMEFADLGDLPTYINNYPPSEISKLKIMYECSKGLAYMHRFDPPLVHRDIKPTNILMMRQRAESVAKLTDFGMGKIYESSPATVRLSMKTFAGTLSFMAPEFYADSSDDITYYPGVDSFSFGLLCHTLMYYTEENHCLEPISAAAKRAKQLYHFGMELAHAIKASQTIPKLHTPTGAKSDCVVQMDKVISEMIVFDEKERIKPSSILVKIADVYNTLLWQDNVNKHRDIKQLETLVQKKDDQLRENDKILQTKDTKEAQLQETEDKIKHLELKLKTATDLNIQLKDEIKHTESKLQGEMVTKQNKISSVEESDDIVEINDEETNESEPEEKPMPKHYAAASKNVEKHEKQYQQTFGNVMDKKKTTKTGEKYFNELVYAAQTAEEKESLVLTKEVLQEREQLNQRVESLQKNIKKAVSIIENKKHLMKQIEENRKTMEETKDYEITVKQPQKEKVKYPPNVYGTYCKICKITCHDECPTKRDEDLAECAVMDNDGKCVVCPGKCGWSDHVSNDFYFNETVIKLKTTIENMKKKYTNAEQKKGKNEDLLKGLKGECKSLENDIEDMVNKVTICLNRLDQIALKKGPPSEENYIDLLIERERQEGGDGYKERIEWLKEMKNKAKTVAQIAKEKSVVEGLRESSDSDDSYSDGDHFPTKRDSDDEDTVDELD